MIDHRRSLYPKEQIAFGTVLFPKPYIIKIKYAILKTIA